MAKTKKTALDDFVSQIKVGESYTSLILGAIVVIVGLILILTFLRHGTMPIQETSSTSTIENQLNGKKTYVVKEGDDLWHIAQSAYGSGYNWVDLAAANNIAQPNVLFTGTKLSIPNVKPKEKTSDQIVSAESQNKITASAYKVQVGDYLWDIAIRAYGDGFKWIDIAKANNLANPDIIYSGTVLKLPR